MNIITFAKRYIDPYYATGALLGFLVRLHMAPNWSLFFDPLYPLIHR